jgi:predicted ArsR family transcriptional regulator
MPTSRQQILAYIRKHQTASAADISRALGMTQANARHHLAHLEANGLIEVTGQRRAQGRGRPMLVYALSRQALGDNLDNLAGGLMSELLDGLAGKDRDIRLRALAKRLAGEYNANSTVQAIPITRRLAQVIERLNELHYQARWEASAGGPRIILGHCPYAGIIEAHPELCQMDAYLLEEWCGSHVQQAAKLQVSDIGLPFCEFLFSD